MTLAEQIAKLKANIKSHQDQIVVKSGQSISKGATPSEETEGEIKQLQDEIAVMQKNLDRLEDIQKSQASWTDTTTPAAGSNSQQGLKSTQGQTIQVESNLEKGIGFALMVKSMALAANSKGAVTAGDVLDSWELRQLMMLNGASKALQPHQRPTVLMMLLSQKVRNSRYRCLFCGNTISSSRS